MTHEGATAPRGLSEAGFAEQPCIEAGALYREHAPFVASFLRHMGVAEQDLDDMMQDVFVLAHRKGGYRPGPATPRTWLASLAIGVAVAGRRKRARRPTWSPILEEVVDPTAGPAQLVEDRRALERVRTALQSLSVKHRSVFILFEIEGESCESIAASSGLPVGTVYSRLHHARKAFLKAYRAVARPRGPHDVGDR